MIPLSIPNLSGNEWKYIKDCLDTNWVSSVGNYVDAFENSVASFTGAKHAVATSNGTTALHLSLLLAGITQGDKVIVPNLTFVASVNAIRHAGAEPILVDVDESNWQMDLSLLEEYLADHSNSPGIKAIMPVHVLGNMLDIERLIRIAELHKMVLVEDSTESLGTTFKGKAAGTFGLLGCLSFNGNKIITTGGGGMIITSDSDLAREAKHLSTQAKADTLEYYHDQVGYNYRLVNLLAAMGVAQMEQLPGFLKRKNEVAEFYTHELSSIKGLSFMQNTPGVNPNNWLFTIRHSRAVELCDHLNAKGIQCRKLWVPMNRLPMFEDYTYLSNGDVAGRLYESCVSLPCSTSITDKQLNVILVKIRAFLNT